MARHRRARGTKRVAALAVAVLVYGSAAGLAEDVPSKLGPDFQVNTFTLGDQLSPDVARYPDGRFVVVWEDITNSRVKARLYNAPGDPAGGEVAVSEAGFLVSPPHAAALPDGGFAVVWANLHDVLLRRFDREGRPLGAAEVVNGADPEANRSPDVAADSRGNLAVVWYRDGFFDDFVLVRRYDAAGEPLGGAVQVNAFTNRRPSAPRVAVDDSGGMLVTWFEAAGPRLLARRFDGPSGAWSNEVKIQAPGGGHAEVSVPLLYREGDGAVVFWDLRAVDVGVFAQPLDAAGAPVGTVVEIGGPLFDSPSLDAAASAAGQTFVVWSQVRSDDFRARIFGRLFDRSWRPLGEAFEVSGDPLDLGVDDLQPAVSADDSGGFTTVWSNGRLPTFFPIPLPPSFFNGRDGSQFGVFGQVLGDPECAAGSEVLCLGEGNRFHVRVSWEVPPGGTGAGHARRLTADTGTFWFFQPSNLELMLKVLDGRSLNGHFWVFYGALSDVRYTLTVTDTETGKQRTYVNERGHLASRADTEAFEEPLNTSRAAPPPAATAVAAGGGCPVFPAGTALCLGSGRFQVEVTFVNPFSGGPAAAHAVELTADTGAFWFFQPSNLELMLKVLDGRSLNGHFWVFFGALSDVEYTVTVTDTETGEHRTYVNERGHLASRADTEAFPAGGG